jgi:hypothetical protein
MILGFARSFLSTTLVARVLSTACIFGFYLPAVQWHGASPALSATAGASHACGDGARKFLIASTRVQFVPFCACTSASHGIWLPCIMASAEWLCECAVRKFTRPSRYAQGIYSLPKTSRTRPSKIDHYVWIVSSTFPPLVRS